MKRKSITSLGLTALVKRNFLAGLLVLVPLTVLLWLLRVVFQNLWDFYVLLPNQLHFPTGQMGSDEMWIRLLGFPIVLFGLVACISILGWISKLYLGQQFLALLKELIERIPILGTLYSSLDQLIHALASGSTDQFRRVVYVEFPRKGMWTLGFVTGTSEAKIFSKTHLNVFVPTVPNPTSGFFLVVPEDEVQDAGMTVEAAFRTILSLGIVQKNKQKLSPLEK